MSDVNETPDFSDLTAEDLTQLSAEERALVEEEQARAGDGENTPANEAGEPAPEAGDPAAGEGEPEPEPAASLPPQLTPQDADAEIARLKAARKEAMTKMMDGDLDPEEYGRIDEETNSKILEITEKKAADLAIYQLTLQNMQADFAKREAAVLNELKSMGLNTKDEAVLKEFRRVTAMFSKEAEADGINDMPNNLANAEFALREARALMQVRHKLQPAATPAQQPAGKTAKARGNEFDRSTIPPTLANVPAAAVPQVSGEFDHLIALQNSGDYVALERAVARMSPEQQQRWLDA